MLELVDVQRRVAELQQMHSASIADRSRIRAIMDWGPDGIKALLGTTKETDPAKVPVPDFMHSGLTRMAQKLGDMPTLKIDSPATGDKRTAEDHAAIRQDVVTSFDLDDNLEMHLPQFGRWVPGYGFGVWVVQEGVSPDGYPYPQLKLRDPYSAYPGYWGVDQEPDDMAIIRRVAADGLAKIYPSHAATILASKDKQGPIRVGVPGAFTGTITGQTSWENQSGEGVQVAELWNRDGTYVIAPEIDLELSFMPNPLRSGPAFIIPRRFTFNALVGQYGYVIGLMGMLAKLNWLSLIFTERSVMNETNVFGELAGEDDYEIGDGAINYLAPNAKVEKPTNRMDIQVFNQIDRTERQLRVVANYPVTDDGERPNVSFLTGRSLQQLAGSGDREVREYQKIFRRSLELADMKRLEWDEEMYSDIKKPYAGQVKGAEFAGTYTPRIHIAGNRRSRRVYGVMAGWDDPSKIVTGLQLLQAGVLDMQTLRENIDGLEKILEVRDRQRSDEAERRLWDMLQAAADQGDPAAKIALVRIASDGSAFTRVLNEFNDPDEEDPSEQTMEALGAGEQPFGGNANTQTILSRLELGGGVAGGAQTVGTL